MPEINIAFVDCETTHLDAEIGEAWEVAVILREFEDDQHTDTEYVWEFSIDPETVDPEALRIGRWHDRHRLPARTDQAAFTGSVPAVLMSRADAVASILNVLSGAILVGSNPAFDERFLRKLVGPGNAQWHYRPYDIVQLAAAKLGVQAVGPLPWPTHPMSRAIGVEPPSKDVAHTALGDARWARDVHDAAMVKDKLPLTLEGRAQHAIGLYTQTAIELEDTKRERDRLRQVLHALRSGLAHAPSAAYVVKLAKQAEIAVAQGADGQPSDADALWPSAVLSALDSPSQPVNTGQISEPCPGCGCAQHSGFCNSCGCLDSRAVVPRTERSYWVDIAAALNAAHAAGMAVGIDQDDDLDRILTDHNAWSVVWDAAAEQWSVAGYEDQGDVDQDLVSYEGEHGYPDDEEPEDEEASDADADVFELISDIAGRLRDATDEGQYHAVGLIADLANGRKTCAEARAELAELTFRRR